MQYNALLLIMKKDFRGRQRPLMVILVEDH
jgi:hypothetical protein